MRYSFSSHKRLYFTAIVTFALSIPLLANSLITRKETKVIHLKTERQLENGLWQKMDNYSTAQNLIITSSKELKLPEFEVQTIPLATDKHNLTAIFTARCNHQEIFSVDLTPTAKLLTHDTIISFSCMHTRWKVSLVQ